MRIDILTLFPNMFDAFLNESILKRAQNAGHLDIHVYDIRESATDKHNTVDDTPYGGGTGMLLRVDVIDAALSAVISGNKRHSGESQTTPESFDTSEYRSVSGRAPLARMTEGKKPHIILLTPQGERLQAPKVESLAKHDWIVLICGHYEGFDERIREHLVDEQLSIGDFVLTGGELAALVVVDAVSRFVNGVLPEDAPQQDSFSIQKDDERVLEYPHYTKPQEYKGWTVPDVLLSGNHGEIEKWRINNTRK